MHQLKVTYMRNHPLRPNLILPLACLLAVLLFFLGLAFSNIHFWGRYLLPIVVVFLWGSRDTWRRDIYIVTALASVLLVATYWLGDDGTAVDLVANHLLPIAILWGVAWLLAQRRQLQDELEDQRRQLLDQQQKLAAEVAARTAELQASEQRYRVLAENAGDLIWTVDMDGNFTYASPAAQRVRGVTREEEQSASWFDRMPPAVAARVASAMEADLAALRAGRPIDSTPHPAPAYRSDGTLMWTETIMSPLYDKDGKPLGLCGTTRDITARHEAEEALRQSQEQLAKIFRSNPGGIAIVRQSDGCFLEANDALLAMVGYTRAQFIGRSAVELGIMPPATRASLAASALGQGSVRGVDMQIVDAHGRAVDVYFSVELIDFGGEPCFLLLVIDITARKQLENALAASERKFRDLYDNSPDMYAVGHLWDQSILDCNQTLAHALGYSRDELIGQPAATLFAPGTFAALLANHPQLLAAGKSENDEVQLRCKDGTLLDALVSGTVEPDSIGGPSLVRVTFRDITERKRAEARVHEANHRLQLATEAAGIGIWSWNLADGSLAWDERMCELHAVTAEERAAGITYALWRARVHPDDLALADPAQGDPTGVDRQWSAAFRIVLPDGAVRHIQGRALIECDATGRPQRFVGINRDITEEVAYDRLLQDTNAVLEQRVAQRTADLESALANLRRANQRKDEFMAMISHELRTPLTGVLTLAELLADEVGGPLSARQSTYVHGITQSGERLLAIVNGILSYTHLLGGSVQLDAQPCELANLLTVCATSQQYKAKAKGQAIAVQVAPPDFAVTVDATALAEVLKRLLDNAIKFTPDGGQVGLEAHLGASAGTAELIVWDTGIGIAPDQIDQVFHAFTQADARLARSHEGIGLGLAYVDQMVQLMGGTISVESALGEGSRFTIILPA